MNHAPYTLSPTYEEEQVDTETIGHYWRDRPGRITGALHALQESLGYLDEKAMKRLAESLEVPLSQVYGVATFFGSFRLEPIGEHHVQVCHGTACHVQGAVQISRKLERDLEVVSGETSTDGRFSLEKVMCLGCCGLAPVVQVDDVIHGRMNQIRIERLFRPNEDQDESSVQS